MLKRIHNILFSSLIIVFSSTKIYSQCAGNDQAITICDKQIYNQGIGNPNGTVNLFSILVGETPGGTWVDVNSSGGLNSTTGILNTYLINRGGVYNYRYTVNGVVGCTDNVSIVTLTLGGFSGVDNLNATACDNNTMVPLFSFLGSNPNPHFNGVWTGGPAGTISGNFFNAEAAGVGTYSLTYTVPAVGICPSKSSNVSLTVHRLPISGTALPLQFCETDDFSPFTNVDLSNQLIGEDSGGTWTDNNGTGELFDSSDSIINIQNIFNNFGPGTYSFSYTVNPAHPICTIGVSTVSIIIRRVIDLNGANLIVMPDICANQIATTTFVGTINQTVNPIPNGTYTIDYTLSGANTGNSNTQLVFNNGTGSFNINPALIINSGVTTVTITSVQSTVGMQTCTRNISNLTDSFTIFPNPDLSDSTLDVMDICANQTAVAVINDGSQPGIALLNGNYNILYNLTGNGVNSLGNVANITVSNGSANFNLNTTGLNPGNYTVTITNITNPATNCTSVANLTDNFVIKPNPDGLNTTIDAQSPVCIGEDILVTVNNTAMGLPNGTYAITYDITGAINALNQTATVTIANGTGNFTISNNTANIAGNYLVTITSILSNTTSCIVNSLTISDSFVVNPLPNPTGIMFNNPRACKNLNALISFTDANSLINGNYTITYNLSGANNSTGNTATIIATNGSGSFQIPSNLLTNNGNTTVIITQIASDATNCVNTNFVFPPITLVIEPLPDLSDSTLDIMDICVNQTAIAVINDGSQPGIALLDGNYDITYNLTGTGVNSIGNVTNITVTNGSANFSLNTAGLNIGTFTVTITNITNPATNCTSVANLTDNFVIKPNPDGLNTTIDAQPLVCLGQNVLVTMNNTMMGLPNGTYAITYDITGTVSALNQSATVTIANGTGTFTISSNVANLPGNYLVTITSILSNTTNCLVNSLTISDSFIVNPLPNPINIAFTAPNICQESNATISFTGANSLTNGNYTLTYSISGANTSTGNNAMITVTNGSGSFVIPSNLIPNSGNSTITINVITSSSSNCSNPMNNIPPITLVINPTVKPTLKTDGEKFCAQNKPTIQNLSENATGTGTIVWYDAPTGGNQYSSTNLLQNGTTYYASLITTSNCASPNRLEVTVDLSYCDDIFIPDGFSPNNDGLNDEFYVKNLEEIYPNFELEIFNRYGNLVYKGNKNTSRFNGISNQSFTVGSDILPTGVYFYVITPNSSRKNEPIQGRLYLSR